MKKEHKMINHLAKVWINRPVEEVFAFLSNKENDLKWQSGLVEVHQPDAKMKVGTRIDEVYSFLGRRINGVLEVTEFEPGRKISTKGVSGAFPIQYTYLLEAANDGTQFSIEMEMKPEGFFALAEPIVGANLKKNMDNDVNSLKQTLEK
jgi:carbon monoxide dehydrogenase subunit G